MVYIKGLYYIFAIVIALFLLSHHHLKYSFGDSIFHTLGLSPWTDKGNSGLHLPVFIGFILIIIGFLGSVRHFRPKYPKIFSRLVFGCIAFFFIFPLATQGAMFLMKYNANDIDSIDISSGKCSFKSEENHVIADCSFTIFNYGRVTKIAVTPTLPFYPEDSVDIIFEKNILVIETHSRATYSTSFNGVHRNGSDFSGNVQEIDFELELDVNSI